MVTVGTGIGGGVVIDGRLYRGATGAAMEPGALTIAGDADAPEPTGAQPRPDTLEALASGSALDRLARKQGLKDGREAVCAARSGDPIGLEVVTRLGRRLGVGIANIISLFEPEVIAIGGGVAAAGELLLRPVLAAARPLLLPGVGDRTQVRTSRTGPHAGAQGAALLAEQELGNSTRSAH